MKNLSLPVTASLIVASLILGIIIGYSATPEYRQTMFSSSRMDLGPADRWIDQRYIDAMIAHHRGAMLLAEQAQAKSTRTEIKNLAADILAGEPKLIAELYAWKKDWYDNERSVKDPIVANLGSADATFAQEAGVGSAGASSIRKKRPSKIATASPATAPATLSSSRITPPTT